jgi:hypothetical protein
MRNYVRLTFSFEIIVFVSLHTHTHTNRLKVKRKRERSTTNDVVEKKSLINSETREREKEVWTRFLENT